MHLGGGSYHTTSEQVGRLRAAVDDSATGPALASTLAVLRRRGFTIGGEQLKRVPKPWDDSHPRADLLRHKSLIASVDFEPAPWLHTAKVKDEVVPAWKAVRPLNDWLAAATS